MNKLKQTISTLANMSNTSTLYFWGASHSGLCSHDCTSPQPVTIISNIRLFDTSGRHSLLLNQDGLFGIGENEFGECGFDKEKIGITVYQPILIRIPVEVHQVVKVVCGYYNSAVITSQGKIYAWGVNNKYQLGLGHNNYVDTPSLVELPDNVCIKDVKLGLHHRYIVIGSNSFESSLALDTNHNAYSWGSNRQNQLGFLDTLLVGKPTITLSDVSEIALGSKHSCLLSKGRVAVCGDNSHGQHGENKVKPVGYTWLRLNCITRISSGWNHCLSLNENGRVFGWGRSDLGQIADTVSLEQLPTMSNIACGAEHSMCQESNGSWWVWGWNEHGALGLGDESIRNVPERINLKGEVAIGCASTLLMTNLFR